MYSILYRTGGKEVTGYIRVRNIKCIQEGSYLAGLAIAYRRVHSIGVLRGIVGKILKQEDNEELLWNN